MMCKCSKHLLRSLVVLTENRSDIMEVSFIRTKFDLSTVPSRNIGVLLCLSCAKYKVSCRSRDDEFSHRLWMFLNRRICSVF